MTTLEEALQIIEQQKAEIANLKSEKTALLAKRDELLGEVKTIKQKISPLGDVDPNEAIAVYNRYQSGELAPKDAIEGQLKGEWEKQTAKEVKELRDVVTQLREEKEQEKAARIKATLHGTFTSTLAPQLLAPPKHLLTILESEGRIKLSEAGDAVGVYKGEELSPEEFVKRLREDESYQPYFKPSGASGSGNSFGSGTKKQANPFAKATLNITEQMRLLKQNPELAAQLKAEANGK